jgi:hypothetical protein
MQDSLPSPTLNRSRIKQVVMLLVCAAACLGLFWQGLRYDKGGKGNQWLAVDPQYLNFGTVWEQADFGWTLPIENRTDEDLPITRFAGTCGCIVQIQPPSLTIPRGQTASVSLSLYLLTPDSQATPEVRDFHMRLTPIIDKPAYNHPGWIVSGKLRKGVRLSSRSILFWKDIVRGQVAAVETVNITSPVFLNTVAAKYDPSALTVRIRPSKEKAGYEFFLDVQPGADLPGGQFVQDFQIEPILDSGERLPATRIRAEGVVSEVVQAIPSSLDLGAQPVGTTQKATVVLRSVTGKPFTIEKIEAGKNLTVMIAKSTQSEQWFEISQPVAGAGPQEAEVRFFAREAQGKLIDLSVQVKCYGTDEADRSSTQSEL